MSAVPGRNDPLEINGPAVSASGVDSIIVTSGSPHGMGGFVGAGFEEVAPLSRETPPRIRGSAPSCRPPAVPSARKSAGHLGPMT